MRTVFILLILLPIAFTSLLAQNEDFQWLFGASHNSPNIHCGYGANWIDFRTTDWQIECVTPQQEGSMDFRAVGTNSSISTPEGGLLFFTDGFKVFNREYQIMENGDSLSPSAHLNEAYEVGLVSEDCAVILPFPGAEDIYMIVHQGGSWVPPIPPYYGIEYTYYSVVDMSYNNGLGKVIEKNKVLMEENVQPRSLNAIRHGNGRDWWIPIRHRSKPVFYVYLLDARGIRLHHVDSLESSLEVFEDQIDVEFKDSINGNNELVPNDYYILDMRVNRGGNQLVYLGIPCIFHCRYDDLIIEYIHRMDFNRCTGRLSHHDLFQIKTGYFEPGRFIELSDGDEFLYLTAGKNLYQFDLNASDVPGSMDTIATTTDLPPEDRNNFWKVRRTPTGEFLVTNQNRKTISVVYNPELRGLSSNPARFALDVQMRSWGDLPNHPNFRLGPVDGSGCDTLGIDNLPRAWYRYNGVALDEYERRFTDLSYYRPESWYWDFGDGTIHDGRYPGVHEFPGPGEYYVCLTVSNELSEDTYCEWVIIEEPSSTVNISTEDRIAVYPNPTTGMITVDLLSDKILNGTISVFNLEGKVILRSEVVNHQGPFTLDLQAQPSGIYILRWVDEEGIRTDKLKINR